MKKELTHREELNQMADEMIEKEMESNHRHSESGVSGVQNIVGKADVRGDINEDIKVELAKKAIGMMAENVTKKALHSIEWTNIDNFNQFADEVVTYDAECIYSYKESKVNENNGSEQDSKVIVFTVDEYLKMAVCTVSYNFDGSETFRIGLKDLKDNKSQNKIYGDLAYKMGEDLDLVELVPTIIKNMVLLKLPPFSGSDGEAVHSIQYAVVSDTKKTRRAF